jgi:hypothetical protein
MDKKIIIHTDASNIKNSNLCKISSITQLEEITVTYEDFCAGTIAFAELIAVIKTLEQVEKRYHPKNFSLEVYTDHLPNVKLFNAVILEKSNNLSRIDVILKRKGLMRQDIYIIHKLLADNAIRVIWLPRKENQAADKLSKFNS